VGLKSLKSLNLTNVYPNNNNNNKNKKKKNNKVKSKPLELRSRVKKVSYGLVKFLYIFEALSRGFGLKKTLKSIYALHSGECLGTQYGTPIWDTNLAICDPDL
jgi:hypothetical protein